MRALTRIAEIDRTDPRKTIYTLTGVGFKAVVTMTDQHFHLGQFVTVDIGDYSSRHASWAST